MHISRFLHFRFAEYFYTLSLVHRLAQIELAYKCIIAIDNPWSTEEIRNFGEQLYLKVITRFSETEENNYLTPWLAGVF